MKHINALLFLTLSLVMAACGPSNGTDPEGRLTAHPASATTSIPPSSAEIPTETLFPAPTMPDYMQPFFEGGYDQMSTPDELYLVYDESSVHYLPGNGIVFNERIIKSWVQIYYVENGEINQGIILDLVIRGGTGLAQAYGKFVWASSMSQIGASPSMTFMENNDRFFADSTPETAYPIMHAPLIYHPTGEAELYEGIFPMVDGQLQSINISGIGTVLPICNIQPITIP